ncbi:30S ribosomal protein S17 [Salinisphaera sp. USBA-960]|uniref:30S ribosomal protein S17 n=1 Tax=Salinisphaera orenii TaxID=856731 RepID=UPI000DBE0DEA|nr:30S ribosomal protein S17 [Salifodinibacter halophilus]NNC26683.1 30S ribosomal protein S17 [Salifodinibacter halophilus]
MTDNGAAGNTRCQTGFVVSNRMDKTAVVVLERRTKHSLYKKYVRRSTRIKVHDEDNAAQIGDFVEVSESRPHARTKSWALVRVIERASQVGA